MPSPSRRRGRSKSPSRRRKSSLGRPSKSPSRKSPSRKSPSRQSRLVAKSSAGDGPDSTSSTVTTPSSSSSSCKKRLDKPLPKSPSRQSRRLIEKEPLTELKQIEKLERKSVETLSQNEEVLIKTTEKTYHPIVSSAVCLLLTVTLPALLIYLNFACSKTTCSIHKLVNIPRSLAAYYDRDSLLLMLGWLLFQWILAFVLPAKVVTGPNKLTYKCNGFLALVVSLALFAVGVATKFPVFYLARKLPQLMVASIAVSFLASAALYMHTRYLPASEKCHSRGPLYDFFTGLDKHPRFAGVDLKLWTYQRPGLIGWAVLTVMLVYREYRDVGRLEPALVLLTAFHLFYVADALIFEDSVLTTKAMQQDGLGFMTMFGSFSWLPFFFSLQTRYMLTHPPGVTSYYALVAIVALEVLGYVIYRGSNTQKNMFRTNPFDPRIANMETIPITSKRVLASGWWLLCRHPNYLGDIIMALAWALTCGFEAIAYLHVAYLTLFLLHRASQDNAYCLHKYGPVWQRYCRRVQYRILPYVY